MAPFNIPGIRNFVLLLTAGATCATALAEDALRIDKVEPPFWWVGMEHQPLQLMVYGDHLNGVTVSAEDARLTVTKVHHLENSHYAFFDLVIPAELAAGNYSLKFRHGTQTKDVSYTLKARAEMRRLHQGFDASDVIYLITPDRFTNGDPANDRAEGVLDEFEPANPRMRHGGDLRGVVDRLDYLKDLGVTALWLNPILENRGVNSYHGYKATDHYRIDPRFGENETYDELVREAHARGLKVIFDHVNNHIGLRHPWVPDLPSADWLNGTVEDHESEKHYLLSISDPHRAPDSLKLLKTFWFVDTMPDLNQRNSFLANYRIQNTLWWIERTGLDGIREDTYPYVDQAFQTRWAKAVRDAYPKFSIVGEIWAISPAYLAQFQDGSKMPNAIVTHLPSVMDFPLQTAFRRFLRKEGKLKGVYEVFAQDFLYPDPQRLLVFLDNHDTPRALLEADKDLTRVQLALTILLTARGIPQLLYGTEIALVGGESHVEVRADFPGGFPDDIRNAFVSAGRTDKENEMFSFVRHLLHLRKSHPALSGGKLIHYPPTWNSDVYKYLKIHANGETILVLANGHEETRSVDLSELKEQLKGVRNWIELHSGLSVPRKETDHEVSLEPLETKMFLLR